MSQTKILIDSPTKTLLVNVADIVMFQFDTKIKTWFVYLANGQIYQLSKKTNSEQILMISDDLFQINLRAIVNLDYFEGIEGKEVVLKGFEERITITRYFFDKLKERFYSL